jgi:hypothetical protein
VIKLREMGWAGYAERVREIILVGKLEEKDQMGDLAIGYSSGIQPFLFAYPQI